MLLLWDRATGVVHWSRTAPLLYWRGSERVTLPARGLIPNRGYHFKKPLIPESCELNSSLSGSSSASSRLADGLSRLCTSARTSRFWYCCCGLSDRV